MRKDFYRDMKVLMKIIRDFGWDREGIQYPEDMKKIAAYTEMILRERFD